MQYGVRSVSMDDVARELAVSKKTLYQFFENKDDLVTEVVRYHMEGEREIFVRIHEQAENAIQELYLLSCCMREHTFKVNPSLLYDLQKYHADAWEVFHLFKHEVIMRQITDNLERGMAEGYYREGLNVQVLSKLRMETVQLAFSDQVFPRAQFDLVEVQMQIYDHFVHGILSPKGKELYHQYQLQEAK